MNVETFSEMLDRLPEACDFFNARFTTHDKTTWMKPDQFIIDDDGNIVFWASDDDDELTMTIEDLKDALNAVDDPSSAEVYVSFDVETGSEDDYYVHSVYRERFLIKWKSERVDIWMDD